MTRSRLSNKWRRGSAVVALALLAACSSSDDKGAAPAAPPKDELRPAPEPAMASPSNPPAGMLVTLPGGGPEGVVADPVTGVVAVALRQPARLALVDAKTARITKVVPVPGAARHLQLAGPGGPVLVPGEDTDVVSRVDLRTGEVGTTTKVGRQPHDAAATGDGRVFVADELGGSASVVNGDGTNGPRVPGPVQPGGVAVAGARVGVVDVRGAQLFVYDAAKAQSLARLPAGDGPTHAVPDGTGGPDNGGIVVADTRGGALLFFRLGPAPAMERRVPLANSPYGLAFDATRRRLWVTLTATNQLVGFDLSGAAATPPTDPFVTLPTVRQPNSVAVDPASGRVFVAGATDATLQVIDPR